MEHFAHAHSPNPLIDEPFSQVKAILTPKIPKTPFYMKISNLHWNLENKLVFTCKTVFGHKYLHVNLAAFWHSQVLKIRFMETYMWKPYLKIKKRFLHVRIVPIQKKRFFTCENRTLKQKKRLQKKNSRKKGEKRCKIKKNFFFREFTLKTKKKSL